MQTVRLAFMLEPIFFTRALARVSGTYAHNIKVVPFGLIFFLPHIYLDHSPTNYENWRGSVGNSFFFS